MIPELALRMLRETDARLLWKFSYNFGYKGMRSVQRFKKRLKRGEHFPPFLYLSIINSCNLRCQGCWVKVDGPRHTIDAETLRRVITDEIARELRRLGNATPLVSIEGTEVVSDERRGRLHVLSRTLDGLDNCIRNRLIVGVATSVCQTNIDDLVNERWLRALIAR